MYYVLLYDLVENYIERRTPFREEHLKLVNEARGRGEIFMAGAFSEPVDGAVLVFRCDDAEVVKRFTESDPYIREGLVTRWRVRRWNVVVGGDS